MNWFATLARLTEPARIRAIVTAVVGLVAALGLTLPFDLPGAAEVLIPVMSFFLPLIQGEATRASVVSPATSADLIATAQQLAAGDLTVAKHHVVPQTPGKADHAAPKD